MRQCPECGEVKDFKGRRCATCLSELDAMREPYVQAIFEGMAIADLPDMPPPRKITRRDLAAYREDHGGADPW